MLLLVQEGYYQYYDDLLLHDKESLYFSGKET